MGDRTQHLVVVVDDDDGMREGMRRVLEIAGYTAKLFASAEELLASDVASRAGCLVIDLRLPGMSGFDLQRVLAAAGAVPPIIFVTAHDLPRVRQRAMASGSDYLVKPFLSQALVESVARAIVK